MTFLMMNNRDTKTSLNKLDKSIIFVIFLYSFVTGSILRKYETRYGPENLIHFSEESYMKDKYNNNFAVLEERDDRDRPDSLDVIVEQLLQSAGAE